MFPVIGHHSSNIPAARKQGRHKSKRSRSNEIHPSYLYSNYQRLSLGNIRGIQLCR